MDVPTLNPFRTTLQTIVLCFLLAAPVEAQRVECTLERGDDRVLSGPCVGVPDTEAVLVVRPTDDAAGRWTGTLTFGAGGAVEVELVPSSDTRTKQYVLRSNWNWFDVEEWNATISPYRLVFDISQGAAPTAVDVVMLNEARRLLSTETWDRADDRDCENDEPGTVGLYCALARATRAAMGRYYHRQPALQRVRRAIVERWKNRVVSHRLMDFNNHPHTTLADVLAVLERARVLTEEEIAR